MDRRHLILAPLALAVPRRATAQIYAGGAIAVEHPWAKPSVGEAAAAFMAVKNASPRPDRMIGASTPIAEQVILRELDGTPLEYFDLLPGRTLVLKPGRRYIALRGLKRILAVDDLFPLTLEFTEAAPVAINIVVAEGPDDD